MILKFKVSCTFCLWFSVSIGLALDTSGSGDNRSDLLWYSPSEEFSIYDNSVVSHERQKFLFTSTVTTIVLVQEKRIKSLNLGHHQSETKSNYSDSCHRNNSLLNENQLNLFTAAIRKPQQEAEDNYNYLNIQYFKGPFTKLIATMDANYNYIVNEYFEHTPDSGQRLYVWFLSIVSAGFVGVSSMFPLFLISLADDNCFTTKDSSAVNYPLKYLLSFAVGGLLGDVFLHLLPEGWNQIVKSGVPTQEVQKVMGFWILCGIFTFGLMEMIFSHAGAKDQIPIEPVECNGHHKKNGTVSSKTKNEKETNTINITGYLNLFANSIDNFTHGLAVGASFLISVKMGLLTTFAIIIHEIPHEIGDFAILVKSGFSKWDAVKAQVSIASVTILGTVATLWADSADVIGVKTAWILPFTSGGFLHIALASILPELLSETNIGQIIRQSVCIATGIAVMALVNLTTE